MSNVPKLRFKDDNGEDYPGWLWVPLSKLANKIGDRNYDFRITNVISNSAIRGLIKQRDYFEKDIANNQNINNYYIIKYGDFVYNPRRSNEAPYGPIKMYKSSEPGIVSPLYLCFRLIMEARINVNFLACYFYSNKWHKYIHYYADRGARYDRVSMQDSRFFEMKIPIPSTKEQTKIANFLTLFDTKIEKQAEKVAALEEYKKGLMQKIFSREIRFKDDEGKDYPEWEVRLFGDIFSFHPTYSYSRAMLNTNAGSIKYIHYGDVHTNYPTTLDVQNTQMPRLNNTIPSNVISPSAYCKEGDLVIADASEDYEAIGKATVLINISNDKIISGLHTILARDEHKHTAPSFRGYLFANEEVKKQIRFSAVGAKVLGISKTNLAKIKINLPSMPEQTKIANLLTLFDRKIEKEKEKLGALQEQKKGLLQQMFI